MLAAVKDNHGGRSPSGRPAPLDTWPGSPEPLGATWDGRGTNFSLFSEVADRVELCLFGDDGTERRVELVECTGFRWHGYLPDVGPGQRYGYRVHGPWDPVRGHRCNPAKLLADPYAKGLVGEFRDAPEAYGHRLGDPLAVVRDDRDSAPFVPRSVVVNPYFDWGGDRPPRVPWHDTVLYELHVRGFTMRHPRVPEALRGTYAGLAHPEVLDYLVRLGVTSVELMPVHHFVHEPHLQQRGLVNYWGYNTLGFFAPHAAYARGRGRNLEQLSEFKAMVHAFHEAGLEVILDVVYNHSAEGSHLGPTLSFRGIDNAAYYRLDDDKRLYRDFTGCGNTLDATRPHVLQLIMDSLRYWVQEMHVDGFRFDLAAALARGEHGHEHMSAFLDVVQQDPVVSRVKLIAEPWDVGVGGYRVGRFPHLWGEWNGKYRDTVRSFWRGEPGQVAELASRISGSADLYSSSGRRPFASVNFVTAHDGFTLRDLVSYERKHNERNGEDNRDGESHNRSSNHGVEGPTDDPAIGALRARQQRNFLATLLLSQGVPLITAGDELGRTQGGNNNAYCLDDETSWVDWAARDKPLREFVRRLLHLRAAHPALRRRAFFLGRSPEGVEAGPSAMPDVAWYGLDGRELREADWHDPERRALAVFVNGEAVGGRDARGAPIVDDSFYWVLCAGRGEVRAVLPPEVCATGSFTVVLDTSETHAPGTVVHPGEALALKAPVVLLLTRARPRSSMLPPPPMA
jgi:glycogen operon protein